MTEDELVAAARETWVNQKTGEWYLGSEEDEIVKGLVEALEARRAKEG